MTQPCVCFVEVAPMVNRTWASEQMRLAGLTEQAQQTVDAMLDAWDASPYVGNDSLRAPLLEIFTRLCQNEAIYVEEAEDEGRWEPARRGNLVVGDIVRVAKDAYTTDAAAHHNGRVARIVGIRYGEIFVRYLDGREPNPDIGIRHPPHLLEKKIQ